VLVVVLAGGQGSRLGLLTKYRAKPALPFAGHYRLIDFPLSNCLHSAVSDVWVLQQYQPASLNDHLSNGRPWDLDRTTGGLVVLPPHQGSGREGWTKGTADGLWRNASLIRELGPRYVVVVSADAVYRLNYRDVLAAHRDSEALLTMVTVRVGPSEAGRYGVVELDGDRVARYEYKPDEPASDVASNEVFVFDTDPVLDRLEQLADEADEDGLQDLGNTLLPALVEDGEARQYRHDGYWRDVGTIESYWTANLEFASPSPPFALDDPEWPVRTVGGVRSPAWVADSAVISSSLVSAGARVAGELRGSVVGPGAVVEKGAVVEQSILLPGAVVRSGAELRRAVVDDGVVVGSGASVGGPESVTVLGVGGEIPQGARVAAGCHQPQE
jgi:glucose-1-phosphate adenylyltransferase